jgi:hypothetical protein
MNDKQRCILVDQREWAARDFGMTCICMTEVNEQP